MHAYHMTPKAATSMHINIFATAALVKRTFLESYCSTVGVIINLQNMPQNNFFLSFIMVALLILCQSIEGRYLKSDEIMKPQMHMHSAISTTNNVAPLLADVSPPTPPSAALPGRDVDNFRPTAPGHSPGVGHTVHN
ncbi:hypothetical protein VNO78_08194 [Psophocarpus tetragonolobus]|uniref:Uncharacterized protein n=1 Tax=Psophocarpus tetragonolobus TaxID=3891 RepID=A0AAN9XSD9_PSOTE